MSGGSPYFFLALLLLTSGWLFCMVAVGPENTAMIGFSDWAEVVMATKVNVIVNNVFLATLHSPCRKQLFWQV
ncbi:MAG: hypothetical protein IH935_07080 [Acidobacteria bacterium]|nr:hypothetical protein [Acidobacteriota bacterium]MCH8268239.1 hypothetical protein [Acidobacteriota bacterium]MCZ6489195.1 hypothetical protein [Acidobacteriota bacterium]MCZ6752729.1 hypothetical protein [Acidobacteriota bacterium]